MRAILFSLLVAGAMATANQPVGAADADLAKAIAGSHRTESFAARDRHRHPQEVLEFFELDPSLTVAEIWPASGWWSEILAPYLRDDGRYFAVGYSLTARRTPEWRKNAARRLMAKFEENPGVYSQVTVTSLSVPDDTEIAPPGSVDRVLTFRNVHNWMNGDYAPGVFEAMYRALKPGGILGLVEHRARPDTPMEQMKRSGYVTEAHVIQLAQEAGFELIERSEINANPNDDRDHPAGVWTLPPSMGLCRRLEGEEQAACMDQWQAIGESDRMTLKFRKPDS